MKRTTLLLLLVALLSIQPSAVQAQSTPSCSFQSDGSILCIISGDGQTGNSEDNGNSELSVCIPGEHTVYRVISHDANTNICRAYPEVLDNCTGQVLYTIGAIIDVGCLLPQPQIQHPCTTISISAGGITCGNAGWKVSARVTFPEIYLDARPYPATLVRWPTAVRNGGLPETSNSGGVDYILNKETIHIHMKDCESHVLCHIFGLQHQFAAHGGYGFVRFDFSKARVLIPRYPKHTTSSHLSAAARALKISESV